jgi:hypothetical protein
MNYIVDNRTIKAEFLGLLSLLVLNTNKKLNSASVRAKFI